MVFKAYRIYRPLKPSTSVVPLDKSPFRAFVPHPTLSSASFEPYDPALKQHKPFSKMRRYVFIMENSLRWDAVGDSPSLSKGLTLLILLEANGTCRSVCAADIIPKSLKCTICAIERFRASTPAFLGLGGSGDFFFPRLRVQPLH